MVLLVKLYLHCNYQTRQADKLHPSPEDAKMPVPSRVHVGVSPDSALLVNRLHCAFQNYACGTLDCCSVRTGKHRDRVHVKM